jgi:Inosine-uridine nucleoside N-ribohydrolase
MKTRKYIRLLFVLLSFVLLASCSGKYTVPGNERQEARYIIYDTDIGSSTDDLFGLGIIYSFAHQKKIELIGGIVCRMGDEYAKVADLMNTYYGFGDIPLGVERHGVENPKVYIPYSGIADMKNDDGTLMFKRSINDYSALPDGWKLYRKLLSEHPDHSVKIISFGFMSAIAQLLRSGPDEYSPMSGIELVQQKVHSLYVMGGKFGEEGNTKPGYNFGHKTAINFSIEFLDKWPHSVPIYFSPSLPGDNLDYPPDEVVRDLAWIEKNPIKQVYKNYQCDTGQRMWDVYPALMALRGVDDYLGDNAPGIVTITQKNADADGDGVNDYEMKFEESPDGYCQYQKLSSEDELKEDMKWVKTCNTVQETVSPIIHP